MFLMTSSRCQERQISTFPSRPALGQAHAQLQRSRRLSPLVNIKIDQPEPTVRAGGGLLGTQAAGRAVPVEASRPRTVVPGRLVLKA